MKQPLVSFAGNHLGDDPRFGNVFAFEANAPITGFPLVDATAATQYQNVTSNPGLSGTVDQWMRFAPMNEPGLPSGAGTSASLVNLIANPVAGLRLIKGLAANTTATAGFYPDVVAGIPMLRLDCERSIVIGLTGAVPTSAFIVTVTGADMWGQLMTAQTSFAIGAPNGVYEIGLIQAQTTPFTQKCFSYVQSIRTSVAPGAGSMWFGVGNTFGFEYYCADASDLVRVSYNGVNADISAAGVPPILFIPPPAPAIYGTIPPIAPNYLGNFYWPTPTATTGNNVRGAFKLTAPGTAIAGGTALLNMMYKCIGASPFAAYLYDPRPTTGNYPSLGGSWSQQSPALRTGYVIGPPQFYDPALA